MKCAYCGGADKPLRICSGCHVMPYCGDDCAAADWPYHRLAEHSGWHSDAMSMILSGQKDQGKLWVGGVEALQDLNKFNIGAVVTVLQRGRVSEEAIAYFVKDRPHLRFFMYDAEDEPIENLFDKSTAFIDRHIREGRNVLVHCYAGVSRSVTLCVCYMMRCRGFETPNLALQHIRKVRDWVSPNDGFMRALKDKA